MQITAQQLSDVLMSLRGAAAPAGTLEQRRFTRMEAQAKIAVAAIADGKTASCYTALTRDISFCGIGLIQSVPPKSGNKLLVRLPRHEKSPLMIVCDIAHCANLADGLYEVGAQFVLEADPNAAQQLAESIEHERQRIQHSILA